MNKNPYLSWYTKNGTLWLSGLWFFKSACAVRFELQTCVFAGSFYNVSATCLQTAEALALMRRIARAFAGRLCDKFTSLVRWLMCAVSREKVSSEYMRKAKALIRMRRCSV